MAGWFLSAPVGLVSVDEDGRILAANAAFGTLIGVSPDQLAGYAVSEFLSETPLGDQAGERRAEGREATLVDVYSKRRRVLVHVSGRDPAVIAVTDIATRAAREAQQRARQAEAEEDVAMDRVGEVDRLATERRDAGREQREETAAPENAAAPRRR